jgi:cbb3-type cytochrome oxidase subunit 3
MTAWIGATIFVIAFSAFLLSGAYAYGRDRKEREAQGKAV